MNDLCPLSASTFAVEPAREVWVTVPKRRPWLHILLFVLTAYTTMAVGARLSHNFANNQPALDLEHDLNPFSGWRPGVLLDGLPFSATLLSILLLHEFG